MKKKYIIIPSILVFLGVFLFFSFSNIKPMEIENAPDWVDIEHALEKAAATKQMILVDVFEVGCKFCRAMEREVYPDPSVRTVIDNGYIPVKLNGNSEEFITVNGVRISYKDFAQGHGAYVFPTTLILDSEGNLVKKRSGYMGIDELRRFLYQS